MPILNTKNNRISSQNGILKDLQPLKNEIKKLTLAIVECKGNISKIKRDLDAFAEVKNKLDLLKDKYIQTELVTQIKNV